MLEPIIYQLENIGRSPIRSYLKNAPDDSTKFNKDNNTHTHHKSKHTYIHIYLISSPSSEASSVPESIHNWRYN